MSTTIYTSTIDTALGPISIGVNERDEVVVTARGGEEKLVEIHGRGCHLLSDTRFGRRARQQVEEYFAGVRQVFELELAPEGSAYQLRVWDALRRIPYGDTRSYGAIARELGSSARAVGRANGSNPICLIVPCHRVIGADGSLTGFAFGNDVKRWLLEHEQRFTYTGRAGAAAAGVLPLEFTAPAGRP